jgi:hypothetical protein
LDFTPNLILMFVSPIFKFKRELLDLLLERFPDAHILGCSTAGEISDIEVSDDSISLTAIAFEKTTLHSTCTHFNSMTNSKETGEKLINLLPKKGLRHVLVLSDGLNVNGADLVAGMVNALPEGVSITGGLAGDGPNFKKTFVVSNRGISDYKLAAVGFYGEDLKIGFGSQGGWDSFGLERAVTKSEANILYELDGKPALELYKSFLGVAAANLPSSGLLFPLRVREGKDIEPVVRTILAINEEDQSLTFAGNIPQGSYVRLMKANIDRLINGAEESAEISSTILKQDASLSILISCVGRRLVLKQLVEEEVEVVKDVLGDNTVITGFYSYGEIAPFGEFSSSQLHNQTMTITSFSE